MADNCFTVLHFSLKAKLMAAVKKNLVDNMIFSEIDKSGLTQLNLKTILKVRNL